MDGVWAVWWGMGMGVGGWCGVVGVCFGVGCCGVVCVGVCCLIVSCVVGCCGVVCFGVCCLIVSCVCRAAKAVPVCACVKRESDCV